MIWTDTRGDGMKKKNLLKLIVICIILSVPMWIQNFNHSESSWIINIISVPVYMFAICLVSGIVSFAGAFILHYAILFYYWLFTEEDNRQFTRPYEDMGIFMPALLPVSFAVIYCVSYANNFPGGIL